jgi:hypothetical protein
VKTHSDGGHFGSNECGINHHVAPLVHLHFPLWEVLRVRLGDVVLYLVRSLSDLPEKSPFCITHGRLHRSRLVLFVDRVNESLVIARTFLAFWSCACLIAELRAEVLDGLVVIIELTYLVEILFDHIDVLVVCLLINARVLKLDNTELMEGVGHLRALFLPAFAAVHVELGVDDRDLFVG